MRIAFKKRFCLLSLGIWMILSPHMAQAINTQDADIYTRIFALQADGNWQQADALIKQLNDTILMGHVLYQRYMHPTKYRSSYKELHLWMKAYADHPKADSIHKLAQKRRPASGWKPLPKPTKATVPNGLNRTYKADDVFKYKIQISPTYPSNMRRILGTISSSVSRGRVTIAYGYLNKNRKKLSRKAHADALGTITRGYYKYHKTSRVFEIAEEAYKMHPETSMYASWWAGLEAFRQQQYNRAITYFVRTAKGAEVSRDPMYAAAYFWAGRSAQRTNNATQAQTYWTKAVQIRMPYRTEFYTLLAHQALNSRPQFDFKTFGASRADEDMLLTIPAIKRGYALALSGQHSLAEMEFRQVQGTIKKAYQTPLLQFAYSLNLPYIQRHIAQILTMDAQRLYAGYAYPDIPYKSISDTKTNRSLVLAFIRQESSFKSFAVSRVGARGLMQVMPATARFIDDQASLGIFKSGYSKSLLMEPNISITLGDAYLAYLLDMYKNDIILTVAGYNAGPGNIQKWRKNTQYNNDPLLLIESIPSSENRQFLETVLSNYWMYRLKYNLPTPTLTAIAKGQWATYVADADMTAEINALQTPPPPPPQPSSRQLIKVRRQ